MIGSRNSSLLSLNTSTGVATRVLGFSSSFIVGGAGHRGVLYITGGNPDVLSTLDLSSGVLTRVGNASNYGQSRLFHVYMDSHDGVLYGVGRSQVGRTNIGAFYSFGEVNP